jgi:hypothetical protein
MQTVSPGELVKVAGGGTELDGIVFDTPSITKVVVAVVDPARGPQFRTVNPKALTERADEGPDDRALRLLIRRTPPPVPGAARGATSGAPRAGQGRSAYTRGAAHRSTGR